MSAILFIAILTAVAGDDMPDLHRPELAAPGTHAVVHQSWAEVALSTETDLSVSNGGPLRVSRGSFVLRVAELDPGTDPDSVRVESFSTDLVIESWSVKPAQRAGWLLIDAVVTGLTNTAHRFAVHATTTSARWKPEYRIVRDETAGTLTIETIAVVSQETGMPWAAPVTLALGPSGELADPAVKDITVDATVPGDGSEQRVPLPPITLPARTELSLTPALHRQAALTLIARLPPAVPLRAGVAVVSAGERSLGRVDLPPMPRGGELRVPFGLEPGVTATRARDAGGAADERATIVVRSTLDHETDVLVHEIVAEGMRVAGGSTSGWENDETGIRWRVHLPPHGTRTLRLRLVDSNPHVPVSR